MPDCIFHSCAALGDDMSKGKKKKLKAAKAAMKQADAKVHDRRSSDLTRNARVIAVEIDDPYATEPGEKITAFKSIRGDPLGRMLARGQIDDAQEKAGRRWQDAYERLESGVRSLDPGKEFVDGGIAPDPFSESKSAAIADLAEARTAIGEMGDIILHDILAERRFPEEVAQLRGNGGQRATDYYARFFRECLEILAVVWGFAMRSHKHTKSS